MSTLVYKELFNTRQQIQTLKDKLQFLDNSCKKKYNTCTQNCIESSVEELQSLKVKMIILEKLCNKLIS